MKEKASRGSGRGWVRAHAGVLLLVAGALVLIFPVVSTLWNNYHQAQLARQVVVTQHRADHTQRDRVLAAARKYNIKPARGPILDPWVENYIPNTVQWREYTAQLNGPHGIMGSVVIPKIGVNLPIYHGTDDSVLQLGVGHLFGTSLPVGGPSSHTVLTAHSGLGTSTMFDHLPELGVGDYFYVDVVGERLKYQVTGTEVVLPEKIDSLKVVPGKDLATLVTCTPYGINTHRLFVHARRVALSKADADAAPPSPRVWQTWMWIPPALIAAAVAALLLWRRRGRAGEHLADRHGRRPGVHRA